MAQGLWLEAAYTWGHAIDNSSDPLVPTQGGQPFPRNSFNLNAELGNSDVDVRQRLAINYVWDLPVGRGHAHLSENSIGKILEGWQIAGITTFATGLPFDIFTDTDTAHTGFIQRPDYNPSATPVPATNARLQTGPNLGLFSVAPFGRGGNLARNRIYCPGNINSDVLLD